MAHKPDLAKRELWRNRLEEFGRGSETIVDFCRRLSVPVWSFYYWQQRLRIPAVSERQPRIRARSIRRAARPKPRRVNFVPVQVVGMQHIEIVLSNGTRVTVPCHARDAIAAVIAALMSNPPERPPC
jgi:hypothetical protein